MLPPHAGGEEGGNGKFGCACGERVEIGGRGEEDMEWDAAGFGGEREGDYEVSFFPAILGG